MTQSVGIIRELAECLLTQELVSPHIPPSIVDSSRLKVPYNDPLRTVGSTIPFEGTPSLEEQLAKGFDDKRTPPAGREALQQFDVCFKSKSAPDNPYDNDNAGVAP